MAQTKLFPNRDLSKGFTLVEMLVVMVLLGLITSILFQGLDLIGKIHHRLIPKIQKLQLNILQERWFRESVSGLIAAVNSEELFIGNSAGFRGLSISPLHSPYTAPAIIEWNIGNDIDGQTLHYQQQELNWKIRSYPVNADLEFLYLDQSGQWQQSWVTKLSAVKQPLLPQAIALKSLGDSSEHWWVAIINGEKEASWWVLDYE